MQYAFHPEASQELMASACYYEEKMKRQRILAVLILLSLSLNSWAWQSDLYDSAWDSENLGSFYTDKVLQDFSYAGYHRGEILIPTIEGPIFNVVDYGADPGGRTDSTHAIQTTIQIAESAGGGVVYLPAGTYKVSPSDSQCLTIRRSNIVLRGAGVEKTFILNSDHRMRSKHIIHVENPGSSSWSSTGSTSVSITEDLTRPTCLIPVSSTSGYAPGDWVIVRNNITDDWIDEHKEPGWIGHGSRLGGLLYCRQLVAVDPEANTVTLDVPIRYTLLQRDNARMYKAPEMLQEVGLEDFSIGNVQHPGSTWGGGDYSTPGKAAYDAHGSYAISLRRARNCWIRNVHSFQPSGNTSTCHILSNGIGLWQCRGISIDRCHFQRPQYGGGGGNGYMYRIMANECLISDCTAHFSRHGFVLSHMIASGNVFTGCTDSRTKRATGNTGSYITSGSGSDHHMHFSHSNLFDGCRAIDSFYAAAYRPYGSTPKHNLTAAHSAYWNMHGQGSYSYVVHTQQVRYGYVIGTSGPSANVKTSAVGGSSAKTAPSDHVEGKGAGATLEPASLYYDQLSRRLEYGNLIAHWPLDENKGTIAPNTTGGPNANIKGYPLWRPEGGMIDGALELNGTTNWIETNLSIDPAQTMFSFFAWIKGGAPGQVILSQAGQKDWLYADPQTGALATNIKTTGRSSPLTSETVITDGDWHCVGLVWDGTHRILYLNDQEAARDPQTLRNATGILILGAGATQAEGTLWSGLIDDVRVYGRAVWP